MLRKLAPLASRITRSSGQAGRRGFAAGGFAHAFPSPLRAAGGPLSAPLCCARYRRRANAPASLRLGPARAVGAAAAPPPLLTAVCPFVDLCAAIAQFAQFATCADAHGEVKYNAWEKPGEIAKW